MKIQKPLFQVLPYVSSILAGNFFYWIAVNSMGDLKDVYINISATLFAIPLIYFFYQIVSGFSDKKLNKVILDYAKIQIDTETLSIVNQLQKRVYGLKNKDFSFKGINKFLSLSKDEIIELVSQNEYSGFQVFKKWKKIENKLSEILKNPFIIQKLENNQVISIILMIISLKHLVSIQKLEDLYVEVGKMPKSYSVKSSEELNQEKDIEIAERYLLYKSLSDREFIVEDFGDFSLYDIGKALKVYRVNEKYLQIFTEAVSGLIKEINGWLESTDTEFIVDNKMFRASKKV